MNKKPVLKLLLIAVPVLVVLFIILVSLQPSQYRITRSLTINAPAAAVFPHINELKQWEAWNPWGKIDPDMKLTYSGPTAGVGASYAWAGNKDVGAGRATITEGQTNESIRFKMEFFQPMAGVSDTLFTFKSLNAQTEVTWTMAGTNNFIGKIFCLFMNMDRMVGGRFEKGLADLKAAVESQK